MRVPGDVGFDRVQPEPPRLVDAVGPLAGVHAEVVQGAGDDPERLAVEQEVVLADAEFGHRVNLDVYVNIGRQRLLC